MGAVLTQFKMEFCVEEISQFEGKWLYLISKCWSKKLGHGRIDVVDFYDKKFVGRQRGATTSSLAFIPPFVFLLAVLKE